MNRALMAPTSTTDGQLDDLTDPKLRTVGERWCGS